MSLLKCEKGEKSTYTLEFSIDKEAFAKACTSVFNKKNKDITIPGFRKGKAPRAYVEKYYGKGFYMEEAINEVLPAAYDEAAKESKLQTVGMPEFDIVSIEDGKDVVMSAKVAVKPEAKIEGYFGIEAEKKVKRVTKKEVDDEIKTIQERNSREIEVTDDTAAVMGDVATIDYLGTVDGVAFEGGKGDEYPLKLGSGNFIPGFEEQICGHKVGESFDVNVTFPEEYHAKELAGKAAVFATTIKKLTHVELPALDDDFAKDISEFDTFEEYKKDVEAKIKKRHEAEANNAFEDALFEELLKKLDAEIPEQMIAQETENQVRDFDYRLRSQGLDLNTYFKYTGLTLEKLREQMKPQAEKQVQLRLALETIAEKENIVASDKDVEEELDRIAKENNLTVEKVKELVAVEAIAADMKVKKALDAVKEKAIIKK